METDVIDVVDSQDGKCLPDRPSKCDWSYKEYRGTLPDIPLEAEWSLRGSCSEVPRQAGDNSCVAQAVVSAIEFLETKAVGSKCEQFSRYFVYYNARRLAHPTARIVADLGTSVRSGIKSVAKMGVCSEERWKYIRKNRDVRPNSEAYREAKLHELVNYRRLQNESMDELRDCLGRGFPFVFLMRYGRDYPLHAEGGYVRLPHADELADPRNLATHSVMAVGYNDETKRLTFMNSKGTRWGDEGYGELDYEYVTDHGLCSDFWTIRKVEDVGPSGGITKK